jgi:Flp pilus assembly pilin Flp
MRTGTSDFVASRMVRELIVDESGQDAVEYSLLAALIGVAAIAIWRQFAPAVLAAYTTADSSVQTLSDCTPDPIAYGGGCS